MITTEKARSLAHLRKVAKKLKRQAAADGQELRHSKALDLAARQCGYPSFSAAARVLPESDPNPQRQER